MLWSTVACHRFVTAKRQSAVCCSKARAGPRTPKQGEFESLTKAIFVVAFPLCRASAFAVAHQRRSLRRGMKNPDAMNQTPHRLSLPSSLSIALPDTARTGRSGVLAEPTLLACDPFARRLPQGYTTPVEDFDSSARSSTLHLHDQTRP